MGICIYLWAGLPVLIVVFTLFFLFYLFKVRKKKISCVFLFFPFIIIIGYISTYLNNQKDDFVLALQDENIQCRFDGQVTKVQATDYGYKLWIEDVIAYWNNETVETSDAIVYLDKKYNRGDVIRIHGEAQLYEAASNPGEFDLQKYYAGFHVGYMIYGDEVYLKRTNQNIIFKWADILSDKLTKSFYSLADEKYASVFCAMLLGNKDDLDEGVYDLFSASGIGHILAISGLHISIIGMGLYKFIRKIGVGYKGAMVISGSIIIFYGIMTGNGVSTIRALIMFLVSVYANVAGRTYDLMSGTCLAGLIMLVESPMLVYNGGFLLSFGAIGGIGIVNPVLSKLINSNNKILNSFLGGLSIQLATVPIVMYVYYEIPIYSILLNMVVVPLMTYVMISALAGGVVGCFWPVVGRLCIATGVYILEFYEKICNLCMKLPGAVWVCGKPDMWQMIMYYAVLGVSLWLIYKFLKLRYLVGIVVSVIIIILRFNNSFEAFFLDVGQGDGIFIRSGSTTFLIDGGSSDEKSLYEFTIEPFLLSEGVDEIDYAFITHADSDHMSGVKELFKAGKIKIKTLVLPSIGMVDEAYDELWRLAVEEGTEVITIHKGMAISDDNITLSCIHPEENYVVLDRNDYSTVLKVEYGDFNMLLTGDISSNVEMELLEQVDRVDVLKVGHHGSKSSSCMEFLEKIQPKVAVISCGEDNSYGHPSEETLERLQKVNAKIVSTVQSGAIIFKMG